jgi:uncharacterized protein (TIGR04255 family)
VIELRIGHDIELAILEKIAHRLKPHYAKSEPMRQVGIVIDNTGGSVSMHEDASGFRLSSEDQADIAILTQRFMTTARLPPYPGWEVLRDRAKANWAEWRSLTPAHPIVRIGVRFINRIDIPSHDEKINLDDYFTLQPRAEAFQATLVGFLLQVRFPTYRPNWIAGITTTPLQPSPVPGSKSIILDIDLSREADIPMHPDKLWPVIDEARSIKNDLFERALTEKAKALFK